MTIRAILSIQFGGRSSNSEAAILGAASLLAILPLLRYELNEHRYAEIVVALRRQPSSTDPLATEPLGHGGLAE